MNDLYGVRIQTSPYVPEGSVVAFSDIQRPADFETWDEQKQLAWLIAHGAVVIMNNVDAGRLPNAQEGLPNVKEDAT